MNRVWKAGGLLLVVGTMVWLVTLWQWQNAGRDVTLADTRRAWRVMETSHPPSWYLPPDDVAMQHLRQGEGRSLCEWKGQADYLDVAVDEIVLPRVAWRYRQPVPAFAPIAGHIAFYPGALECLVDDQPVQRRRCAAVRPAPAARCCCRPSPGCRIGRHRPGPPRRPPRRGPPPVPRPASGPPRRRRPGPSRRGAG